MIKYINSPSKWFQTNNGPFAHIGNYNQSASNFVGSVRYNTSNSSLEAWDGNNWIPISTNATIEPTGEMCQVLEWAQEKMWQDQRIQELIKTNPTVADAHQNYVRAAEQLAIVAKLVQP